MGAAGDRRHRRLPSAGAGDRLGRPVAEFLPRRPLFAIRWKLGELLGWDGPDVGLGSGVPTLGDRLPADLRDAPSGPDFDALPFTSLYRLGDEWAAEIANRTMHGVMHIGWVPDGTGGYRGQMAVLVKPNGLFGTACMAAIRPFRHLIVYPAMLREIEREWRARRRADTGARGAQMTARDTRATIPITASSARRSDAPAPSRKENGLKANTTIRPRAGRRSAHDADM